MVTATDLKNGTTFVLDNKPYKVLKYAQQKIGRGGSTVKLSIKNLQTGQTEDKTFNGTVRVEEISTQKRRLQYLYSDSTNATFMDPSSFTQTEIPLKMIDSAISYIKEGDSVNVLFWEDKALAIEIPPNVVLKVAETVPGVKGNSATNIYKPARLENDLTSKVPLFIKVGDMVRIDTRTGEYVERVN